MLCSLNAQIASKHYSFFFIKCIHFCRIIGGNSWLNSHYGKHYLVSPTQNTKIFNFYRKKLTNECLDGTKLLQRFFLIAIAEKESDLKLLMDVHFESQLKEWWGWKVLFISLLTTLLCYYLLHSSWMFWIPKMKMMGCVTGIRETKRRNYVKSSS